MLILLKGDSKRKEPKAPFYEIGMSQQIYAIQFVTVYSKQYTNTCQTINRLIIVLQSVKKISK